MILSIFLGQKVGLDSGSLKVLALAALIHDLGRKFLPIDYKTGANLSPEDTPFIHLHALDGAAFLTSVQGVALPIVRAALEHHRGYQLQGYPAISHQKVHPFSQIIAIADFVSWGTVTNRIYHRPGLMHRRLRSLLRRAGKEFNPVLVKLLISFLGVYPSGTRVELSDGRTAVVLEQSSLNIARPVVAVQQADGGWTPFDLNHLGSDQQNFGPFIRKITGIEKNISRLIEIIPDAAVDSV